jgi:hypothetical protein
MVAKPSTNGRPAELDADELVVIYDIMWEAATRLRGLYSREVREGVLDDPAIKKMREISAEVEAVDPDDLAAQQAMAQKLRREYAARSV